MADETFQKSDVPRQESVLGIHLLADLFDCARLPTTAEELRSSMEKAALATGATLVQSVFHQFSPYGLSGVIVIAESHLAIHTWPEHRTACVDMFSCNIDIQPEIAVEILRTAFGAERVQLQRLCRAVR